MCVEIADVANFICPLLITAKVHLGLCVLPTKVGKSFLWVKIKWLHRRSCIYIVHNRVRLELATSAISRFSIVIGFRDIWIDTNVQTQYWPKMKCTLYSLMSYVNSRAIDAYMRTVYIKVHASGSTISFFARKIVASLSVQSWWSLIVSDCTDRLHHRNGMGPYWFQMSLLDLLYVAFILTWNMSLSLWPVKLMLSYEVIYYV